MDRPLYKEAFAWHDSNIMAMRFDLSAEKQIICGFQRYIRPETKVKWDMHYPLELGIVLSGKIKRYYSNWKKIYHPGEVWFNGIWDPHGWMISEVPCEVIYLIILPEVLFDFNVPEGSNFNAWSPFVLEPAQRPHVLASQRPVFLELGKRLAAIRERESAYAQSWFRSLLFEILLEIHEGKPQGNSHSSSSYSVFLNTTKIFNMIFGTPRYIREQEAAHQCGMSLQNFRKLFMKTMGISFSHFALKYRVDRAANALRESDQPVKTIAYTWGFRYVSHFIMCFHRFYGCSPNQYRQKCRNHFIAS